MSDITRRTLFAGVGMAILAACACSRSTDAPASPTAGGATDGDRFQLGDYNTRQVVDELRYIEANTSALPEGDRKRIFVSGSTAGLGELTAAYLLARGHRVVAHARNEKRAADVRRELPGLEAVVVADFQKLDETRALATRINELGAFDAVIHNAGEYDTPGPQILNTNALSSYLLTALVNKPGRLIYVSSSMHQGGAFKLDAMRSGGAGITYSDTKLDVLTLAMAVARLRPDLKVNALCPGWVPTLMGMIDGPNPPDNLREGYMTQVWLAEGIEPGADGSARYLRHRKPYGPVHAGATDPSAQDALLEALAHRTGTTLA